jgi:flagellar biosynthesis/type III secretory pathway chaperone
LSQVSKMNSDNTNDNIIREYREGLQAQIGILETLYRLAGRKREALLKEDLKALPGIIQEEEEELAKFKSLGTLDEEVPGEPAPGIRELLMEREFLARQIREMNFFNHELIEDSLAYIRFSLQLFQGQPDSSLYGTGGIKETPTVNSLIDMRG